MLHRLARMDSRIKVHFNRHNQGICKTTNRALDRASSPFCVFLDQ